MNQLKKTTFARTLFAVLGVGAAGGLGSLIAARPWATTTGRCWERAISVPSSTPGPTQSQSEDSFKYVMTFLGNPTAVSTNPLLEGDIRLKCDHCGQEYEVPRMQLRVSCRSLCDRCNKEFSQGAFTDTDLRRANP